MFGYISKEGDSEQRQKEDFLFSRNIDMLLTNTDYIINKPELHFCTFGNAYLSIAYMRGGHIPLGILLSLWRDNELIDTCPDCGGRLLIIGSGGSPLSGTHSYWGYCEKCLKRNNGKKESFSNIYTPLLHIKWEDDNVKPATIYDVIHDLQDKETKEKAL